MSLIIYLCRCEQPWEWVTGSHFFDPDSNKLMTIISCFQTISVKWQMFHRKTYFNVLRLSNLLYVQTMAWFNWWWIMRGTSCNYCSKIIVNCGKLVYGIVFSNHRSSLVCFEPLDFIPTTGCIYISWSEKYFLYDYVKRLNKCSFGQIVQVMTLTILCW